ncbi:TasA family protein [Nocardioides daphniae]|uniref:Camelysin metallo-endopeptidase n=1 Tax=Nocardioides daphniae TaxID=402297 RepID=A0A4P7UDC5_9ACTN|nr:TasA family protein [Nocardioides daphniae]QCC78076.1 hypothetical protein E2C04_14385 [Nocardioides daphniae]GGD22391.1 hypothetical protein GCM10007231_21840 [Nocardioides daphniae]
MNAATTAQTTSRSKKVLVPLATLLVAGAVAVGSGATFTSTTGNTISAVTSGTLTQSNSKDGKAVFNLTNMKPGDTVTGALTLKNTGSLPAKFTLTETKSVNGFDGSHLKLVITDTSSGTQVYTGTFGGLEDGVKKALGQFAPEEAHTYSFAVSLDAAADNTQQGRTANATYAWDSVQLDGENIDQR